MTTLKLFWAGDGDEYCGAAEFAELHVTDCDEPGVYMAEDTDTGEQSFLCRTHVEAAKQAGLTLPSLETT